MTRIFYTYRDADRMRVPGCFESTSAREDAIEALKSTFAGSSCKLIAIKSFNSQEEVLAEIAEMRSRIKALPGYFIWLRKDFESYVTQLEQELN